MSREILFRGKDYAENWHYGVPLVFSDNFVCIATPHTYNTSVIPETVGQYTGLRDCKRTEEYPEGQMIFEGDIIKGWFLHMLPVNAVVAFKDGAFGLEWYRGDIKAFNAFTSICNVEYEVIGNIHDNPELLND